MVGLLATGGSDHHYLVLEHELRPLLGFFGAFTPARTIYATPRDFDAQKQVQGRLVEEIRQLGQEVILQARFLATTPGFSQTERVRAQSSNS